MGGYVRPNRRDWNFLGGGGFCKAKTFIKKCMTLKEARKGFYVHARAQSAHAITKMHASAESV